MITKPEIEPIDADILRSHSLPRLLEHKSVPIALAAMTATMGLDADRSALYFDLVLNSLTEAARRALQAMKPAKYEYQSDFARHYFAKGKAEGKAEARTELIQQFLTLRYGALPEAILEQLQSAEPAQLEVIIARAMSTVTLEEALGDDLEWGSQR